MSLPTLTLTERTTTRSFSTTGLRCTFPIRTTIGTRLIGTSGASAKLIPKPSKLPMFETIALPNWSLAMPKRLRSSWKS